MFLCSGKMWQLCSGSHYKLIANPGYYPELLAKKIESHETETIAQIERVHSLQFMFLSINSLKLLTLKI